MEGMKIVRDHNLHVVATGGIAGYGRSTQSFRDPSLKKVIDLQTRSTFLNDSKSTEELDDLNKKVDPFFKLGKL